VVRQAGEHLRGRAAGTGERENVNVKEVLGSMVRAEVMKGMVTVLMVLLLVTPLWGQQAKVQARRERQISKNKRALWGQQASVQDLPNGVTRDGLSIALAKLEREGEEVRVGIAFRKVGHASGSASFHLNIRDDRGNTYPSGPYTVVLSVPDIRFVVDRMDLALLPVGFTWIASAGVEMPAKAPIHSILVYGGPLKDGVSLDPQSAKWPTIDLDVVRENDLTGKKFKLSRDISVWLGQPILEESEKVLEEKTQRIRWRIPVFIQNEDYNPQGVPLSYIHYFLYFPSGEIMFLPVDTWSSEVISGVDLDQRDLPPQVPAAKTIEITHATHFIDPFNEIPAAILVQMSDSKYGVGHRFKMLGFLPLQPGRGAEAGGVASGNREAGTAWRVHNAKMNYHSAIYANGLFVVGGSEGTILTSPDGEEWTIARVRTEGGARDKLIGMAYGNGVFVAVDSWGGVLTSTDGKEWSHQRIEDLSAPIGDKVRDWLFQCSPSGITYGKGVFAVVCGLGQIRISPDGKKWEQPDEKPSWGLLDRKGLRGVAYANGLFIAVGSDGAIVSSLDGKKWREQTSGTRNQLEDVSFGNGVWVAVGSEGTILTSPDGKKWTRQDSGIRNDLSGITYGNGLFVAVGSEGTILISPDGRNWTKQNSGTTKHLHDIAYGNGLFVAVGDGVILTSRLGKVSDTSSREPAAAQKPTTTIKEKLPVKVGDKVVFVVPVAELPSDLQERLKGKASFAVIDEQGKIPKDKMVIFKALVAWHVARNLLDSPESGWDVNNAKNWANSFEDRADKLGRILVQQGIADLLTEAGNLGARWLVIGGLAGATVPISVPRAAIKAAVDQFLYNPKNVMRALLSADLAVAVKQMKKAAALLRSIQGYPLDSDLALKLLEVDALDAPLGSEAALARLKIAGEVPEQLLEPFIAALKEGERLLRETAEPKVAFVGEWVSVTDKLVGLLRQVEGWNAYENERRKIIDNWINLLRWYLETAENIYSVAETAAETASPSGKSESSEQRTPQGAFQAKLLWQRKFKDFPIWDVAISPDGRFLAVAGGSEYLIDKEGGVRLVRATDGASLKFLSLGKGNYASRVAFSPDGKLLAVENHEVSLWRVDSGSLVRKKGSKKDLESFLRISRSNVSPDGKLVAKVEDVVIEDAPECGGLVKVQQKMVVRWVKDGRVAWHFATKFQCESPDAPPSSHSAAVFSPDGSLLALAGGDGIIRIWSVQDRKLVGTLKMPPVYSLAFSKDGKLLSAGGLTIPGEVRLWRVKEE
jgi:hypothetical protein